MAGNALFSVEGEESEVPPAFLMEPDQARILDLRIITQDHEASNPIQPRIDADHGVLRAFPQILVEMSMVEEVTGSDLALFNEGRSDLFFCENDSSFTLTIVLKKPVFLAAVEDRKKVRRCSGIEKIKKRGATCKVLFDFLFLHTSFSWVS